jgi:hypothetical protein
MKEELDILLCQRFPHLYCERSYSVRESCMAFGFEHGDGWFNIIYMLSAALEPLCMPDQWDDHLRAAQVKEKFGTLHFYLDGYSSLDENERGLVDGLVRAAEYLSSVTCEACGRPGTRRNDGWIRTLCDGCHGDRP